MTRRGHKRKNWPVWQCENDAKNGMLMEWNNGPLVEVNWLISMFVLSFTTVFWCIFGGAPPDFLFYIKKNLRFDFSKKDVNEFWISPSPCTIWEQMLSCSFIGKNSHYAPSLLTLKWRNEVLASDSKSWKVSTPPTFHHQVGPWAQGMFEFTTWKKKTRIKLIAAIPSTTTTTTTTKTCARCLFGPFWSQIPKYWQWLEPKRYEWYCWWLNSCTSW